MLDARDLRPGIALACHSLAGKLYFLVQGAALESFLSSSGGGLFGRSVTFGSGALFNFWRNFARKLFRSAILRDARQQAHIGIAVGAFERP